VEESKREGTVDDASLEVVEAFVVAAAVRGKGCARDQWRQATVTFCIF
jgi:hypothetical protein